MPYGILEILCCDPKGSRDFLWILSTEGRSVGLCWAKSKPKGPKAPACDHGHCLYPFTCAIEDRPLAAHREPHALVGWFLQVLYCVPKGSRFFWRILSTEGPGGRLCRSKSRSKRPKVSSAICYYLAPSADVCLYSCLCMFRNHSHKREGNSCGIHRSSASFC